MRSRNIIVLGSVNVDLVVRSSRLPAPGETVLGGEFLQAPGGKGANQAVAAARAGNDTVVLIAAVGGDAMGQQAYERLAMESLDVHHLHRISRSPTGVALIMVDKSGENSISVASGANSCLGPAQVNLATESFQEAAVFLTNLESPLDSVRRGLELARQFGAQTILNPAPADEAILHNNFLSLVDVLTPNVTEATALSGIDASDQAGAEAAARRLVELGAGSVIITRGSAGCLVLDANQRVTHISAPTVSAVDTTAAGDALNGILAVALSEELTLADAARRATWGAALSVTRMGAQPSLPNRSEIDKFLTTHSG